MSVEEDGKDKVKDGKSSGYTLLCMFYGAQGIDLLHVERVGGLGVRCS